MTLAAWEAPTTISIWTDQCLAKSRPDKVLTYLDGATIDKESVELLEGLASAVRLAEDDIGDAAADRVGTVGDLDLLDEADGLSEVLLKSDVSLPIRGHDVRMTMVSASQGEAARKGIHQRAEQ